MAAFSVLMMVLAGASCRKAGRKSPGPAEGTIALNHVAMTITMPPGWYRGDDDDEQLPHGHARRVAFLHGSASDPDVTFSLERLNPADRREGQFSRLGDDELANRARGGAAAMAATLPDTRVEDCGIIWQRERRMARCFVEGDDPKRPVRSIVVYFWAASGDDLGSASVLSGLDGKATAAMIEPILETLSEPSTDTR